MEKSMWSIAIHGGAGAISKNISAEKKTEYITNLKRILDSSVTLLQSGQSALDVVQHACELLENCPLFNAGCGAVLDETGQAVLEASIMKNDKSCGAAAGLKTVKNPIKLARAVMENTPHHMLIGEGAELFAVKMGLEIVENEYFITDARKKLWEDELKRQSEKINSGMGTIGCVARDIKGNMAAGTSTGGRNFKMKGRVGDTPIIGAGNYCNQYAAVSGTGIGEVFLRNNIAYQVCARMEFGQQTLQTAVKSIIDSIGQDVGGIISIDKDNNISMEFNTWGMHRAAASSSGYYIVAIWDNAEEVSHH
jgi:beta-aspartyl-peptidase (threonine type)